MTRLPLVGLLVLAACGGGDPGPSRPSADVPDPAARRVEVATLRLSDAAITLQVPGEVEGWEDALLASAAGGRVEQVRVSEGEEVRRGQVLVVIDRELHAARVAQSEANLRQAKDELARTEQLGEFATGAELDAARTKVDVADANLRVAQAQLDRAVITAPFAGTVGDIALSEGEMASPGAPVVRLVQLDPVKVVLSVSDRDVVALVPGTPASVRTHASAEALRGTISHIGPVGDLQTRAFSVEVKVPSPQHALLPGMIAKVEVNRTIQEGAVVLPQDWLVTRLDSYGVFVVEDGAARWRDVVLGEIVRGDVVITSGLSAGDRVVFVGQHDLVDGDLVLVDREGWCCDGGRPVFDGTTAARTP